MGDTLTDPKYTSEEHSLWKRLYEEIREIQPSIMNKRYLMWMQKAETELKYARGIPRIQDLCDYLRSATGFQIKPVHGIISQR